MGNQIFLFRSLICEFQKLIAHSIEMPSIEHIEMLNDSDFVCLGTKSDQLLYDFVGFHFSIFNKHFFSLFKLFLFPFDAHSECLTYLIEINRPFNPVGVLFIHYWHCFNVNRSIQFTNLFSYAMRYDVASAGAGAGANVDAAENNNCESRC